jgi:hypothetical protein
LIIFNIIKIPYTLTIKMQSINIENLPHFLQTSDLYKSQ